MSTVIATRLIDADIEAVWSELADVRLVADWHPGVATGDLLSPEPTGDSRVTGTSLPRRPAPPRKTVTMDYEMRLGVLGAVMDALVVKRRMPKLLDKALAGLEHHVISGQIMEETVSRIQALAETVPSPPGDRTRRPWPSPPAFAQQSSRTVT